jgi:DNA repair photolyase
MKNYNKKSLLYKTGVEYGDYTINHCFGCAHGCRYPCYAYLMAKRFAKVKNESEWERPVIVANALELLDKEIPHLKSKIKSVQLSFSTDPFMVGYPEVSDLSISCIKKLNDSGIKCVVLTKGELPASLANLSKKNEYGITLVSLSEKFREKYEPGATTLAKRLAALRFLHDAGCKTWVSIEPYPTPNILKQDLMEVLNAVSFVDRIVFGRMHYNKTVTKYKNRKKFYNDSAAVVIEFCKLHNIQYHIKTGTITD